MSFNRAQNRELSKYLVSANILRKIRILHSARVKTVWYLHCHSHHLFRGLGWRKWNCPCKGMRADTKENPQRQHSTLSSQRRENKVKTPDRQTITNTRGRVKIIR